MNDDIPTDLSALDPTQPPAAFARRVAAVRTAAGSALRRRRAGTPLAMVAHWRVPLLAALVLMMLCSAVLLRSAQADTSTDVTVTDEVADALDVSAVLGDGSDTPTTSPADILLGGYEQ